MTLKLLTEQHLEFLCLMKGWAGLSESIHVKMPHCWKSHVTAHMRYLHLPATFVGILYIQFFWGDKNLKSSLKSVADLQKKLRIQGECLLISSFPGKALRMLVES